MLDARDSDHDLNFTFICREARFIGQADQVTQIGQQPQFISELEPLFKHCDIRV